MPVYPSEAETNGGKGIVWLDESGGYIQIAVAFGTYTQVHKFHVNPFASDGTYIGPSGSQEVDLNSTAANIIALMKPLYTAAVALSPLSVYQSNSAHDGVNPFPYSFDGALTTVGSDAGPLASLAAQISIVAKGSDQSRWQTHLFGISTAFFSTAARIPATLAGDASHQLAEYFVGARTGPGLAGHGVGKDTMVVSHSGQPLVVPAFLVFSFNKRMRRRLKVA